MRRIVKSIQEVLEVFGELSSQKVSASNTIFGWVEFRKDGKYRKENKV